jgi:mannose-6-phosphate isomerase-like protein (cupin superfamily)
MRETAWLVDGEGQPMLPAESGAGQGGSDNRHKRADQWFYVVRGTGAAVVQGEHVVAEEAMAFLISATSPP